MEEDNLLEDYGQLIEPITGTTYRLLYNTMLEILYSDDSNDDTDLLCVFAKHYIVEQLKWEAVLKG